MKMNCLLHSSSTVVQKISVQNDSDAGDEIVQNYLKVKVKVEHLI